MSGSCFADVLSELIDLTPGENAALEKLEVASHVTPMDANPSTAHLFIVNPLSGQALMRLFSTHPPIEERIARLRAMRV